MNRSQNILYADTADTADTALIQGSGALSGCWLAPGRGAQRERERERSSSLVLTYSIRVYTVFEAWRSLHVPKYSKSIQRSFVMLLRASQSFSGLFICAGLAPVCNNLACQTAVLQTFCRVESLNLNFDKSMKCAKEAIS